MRIYIVYINTLEGNINWIFCPKMKKRHAEVIEKLGINVAVTVM